MFHFLGVIAVIVTSLVSPLPSIGGPPPGVSGQEKQPAAERQVQCQLHGDGSVSLPEPAAQTREWFSYISALAHKDQEMELIYRFIE